MSSSATGVGMPICFLGAILLILTQKSSQKFGDVLGIMVFGLVPLMMAHGVGANGSRSLATGVIGGMIVGTLALLFLVPSLFIVFQYIQERVKHN